MNPVFEQTTTRYRVRVAEARSGWWPRGIAPIAGFLAIFAISVCHVAPERIEKDVERTTAERLEHAGHAWTTVAADGQDVLITGTAPEPVSDVLLASLARATECHTLLAGQLGCPARVRVDIEQPPRIAPDVPSPAPDTTADRDTGTTGRDETGSNETGSVAPIAGTFALELTVRQDRLVLTGDVPSEAHRRDLLAAASARFPDVVDQLTLANHCATPSYARAWAHALTVLAQLDSGTATWSDGALSLRGIAPAAELTAIRSRFAAPEEPVNLGAVELIVKEEADSCDDQFAARLSRSTIRFATASTAIEASSRQLLTDLAEVAKRCPGTLAIEGHTDNVGTPESNQTLSQGRADAVARALGELGVDTDRLSPEGVGQSRPVAPNTTEAGRAQNRRIEIRIRR